MCLGALQTKCPHVTGPAWQAGGAPAQVGSEKAFLCCLVLCSAGFAAWRLWSPAAARSCSVVCARSPPKPQLPGRSGISLRRAPARKASGSLAECCAQSNMPQPSAGNALADRQLPRSSLRQRTALSPRRAAAPAWALGAPNVLRVGLCGRVAERGEPLGSGPRWLRRKERNGSIKFHEVREQKHVLLPGAAALAESCYKKQACNGSAARLQKLQPLSRGQVWGARCGCVTCKPLASPAVLHQHKGVSGMEMGAGVSLVPPSQVILDASGSLCTMRTAVELKAELSWVGKAPWLLQGRSPG